MKNYNFNKKLYVITESTISKKPNEQVVREAIKGGAEIIQLREKDWPKEKIKEEAIKLLKICKENNAMFIVNDYIDIALDIRADGVHLGQADMPISEAKEICKGKLILGLSTHSLEQAEKADKEDIDYISIGPIFKTRAKKYTVGLEMISKVISSVNKPVFAIGGINKNNIDEVLKQGAKSAAVISAVVSAENIEEEARKLVEKIKNT